MRARGSEPDLPYVPVDGTPWRHSMGLRRLDPAKWLEVDEHRDDDLRAKERLLRDSRASVLATLPHGLEASAELLALVVADLATHHQGLVAVDSDQLTDSSTGLAVDCDALHPIEAASRVVQEDLCVLERADEWRLSAACVCFPSRWRLTDKIGETLLGIHAPVPGFESELGRQTVTFFDRLTVDRPVWRLNWTLLDTPELHLPSPSSRTASAAHDEDVGQWLWFRVERQTLRRLPATGAIVFTIRTHLASLGELVTTHPDAAGALRDTMGTVGADVAHYKGWTSLLDPLRAWLAKQAKPS